MIVREEPVGEPKPKEKPFVISKWVVVDAYEKVKANQGAAGVDGESIAEFERDLKGNLYGRGDPPLAAASLVGHDPHRPR